MLAQALFMAALIGSVALSYAVLTGRLDPRLAMAAGSVGLGSVLALGPNAYYSYVTWENATAVNSTTTIVERYLRLVPVDPAIVYPYLVAAGALWAATLVLVALYWMYRSAEETWFAT